MDIVKRNLADVADRNSIAVLTEWKVAAKVVVAFAVVEDENPIFKSTELADSFDNTEVRRSDSIDCCYDLLHHLYLEKLTTPSRRKALNACLISLRKLFSIVHPNVVTLIVLTCVKSKPRSVSNTLVLIKRFCD